MFGYRFLSFAAGLLCLGSIYAVTSEEVAEITKVFQPFVEKCAEEYGITVDQFKEAREKKSAEGIDPCFMSCFMKESGFFDGEGKFDDKTAKEFVATHLTSERAITFMDAVCIECIKVNDEEVSDGDQGCDRAKLMWSCIQDLKEKMEGSE